jgi:hypothetical protein
VEDWKVYPFCYCDHSESPSETPVARTPVARNFSCASATVRSRSHSPRRPTEVGRYGRHRRPTKVGRYERLCLRSR